MFLCCNFQIHPRPYKRVNMDKNLKGSPLMYIAKVSTVLPTPGVLFMYSSV